MSLRELRASRPGDDAYTGAQRMSAARLTLHTGLDDASALTGLPITDEHGAIVAVVNNSHPLAKKYGQLLADTEELIEALDQMTAWARHVKAECGRALVLAGHIETAQQLLAKHGAVSRSVHHASTKKEPA
jgi:hypothetical protein